MVTSFEFDGGNSLQFPNEGIYDYNHDRPFSLAFWFRVDDIELPSHTLLSPRLMTITETGYSVWCEYRRAVGFFPIQC